MLSDIVQPRENGDPLRTKSPRPTRVPSPRVRPLAGKGVLGRLCSPRKACLEGFEGSQGSPGAPLLACKGALRRLRGVPRSARGLRLPHKVGPKTAPEAPRDPLEATKSPQEAPKMQPSHPKRFHETPKRCPSPPKRRPRCSQVVPRGPASVSARR